MPTGILISMCSDAGSRFRTLPGRQRSRLRQLSSSLGKLPLAVRLGSSRSPSSSHTGCGARTRTALL